MKKEALVPVLTAFLALTVPAWAGSQVVLDGADRVPLIPDAVGSPGSAEQALVPTDVTPAAISGTLTLGSLDTRQVDVGIDFLVLQTTAATSEVEDGVGLMLTFTGP